jgi:hypothetical protein
MNVLTEASISKLEQERDVIDRHLIKIGTSPLRMQLLIYHVQEHVQ